MTVPNELPVKDIVVGERARKQPGSILGLVASIERLGLLHPVVVNGRGELIAGFRRLQAVKELGWKTVPVRVVETFDDALLALLAEMHENTAREPLSPTEMVELGKRIEAIEKPEAKERQGAGLKKGDSRSGKLPERESQGQTRDKVGKALGIGGKTYEKAKQVAAAAEENPELFGDLPGKMDAESVDAAHKELKKRRGCNGQDDEDEPDDDGPPTHVGWAPPDHYAGLAEAAVKDLRRFRTKLSAIFEGPCGPAVRERYIPYCGPRWGRTGETVQEATAHGVRVMSYVHECEELAALIRQAGALATWLRTPEVLRTLPDRDDAA